MKTERTNLSYPSCCVLESDFVLRAFCAGQLAGSPRAEIIADPLVYKGPDPLPGRPFIFTHIPAFHLVHKPGAVVTALKTLGGVKS